MSRRGLIPLVDLAYQGFGRGLDEGATGVRLLASRLPELLVAFSCSKNFGLYCERAGCTLVLAENAKNAAMAGKYMAQVARPLYSVPPDHGSIRCRLIMAARSCAHFSRRRALSRILALGTREGAASIVSKRRQLAAALRAATGTADFDYLEHGVGMFSLLNLSRKEIAELRRDRAIYIVEDGRINVAGLPLRRTTDFVQALTEVLAKPS
jgi:aspartate/tyrosine/aromatic aminotransferase